MLALAKRKKRGRKSFVYKKEKLRKKGKCCFLCFVAHEKKGRCFFAFGSKKENFVHIKAFLIHQWKGKDISQGINRIHSQKLSQKFLKYCLDYCLIFKELQLRRHFQSSASASSSYMNNVVVSRNRACKKR